MNQKLNVSKIVSIVLCAVVISYLVYSAFASSYSPVDTIKLNEKTAYEKTIAFQGFTVRDEAPISRSESGTVIPLVKDGKRVAKGDAIAVVCNNDEDANTYKSLENANAELERLIELSNAEGAQALDAEKLNAEISAAYKSMMDLVSAGNYDNIAAYAGEFAEKSAVKQQLSGGSIDLSAKITSLEQTIQTLKSKNISYTPVSAPGSGYYITSCDGYESTLKYEDVKKLSAEQIKSAMQAEPKPQANADLGKLVGSYRWYVVGVADKKDAADFPSGRQIRVNFPESGLKDIPMEVESVRTDGDGLCVVLSCNLMNETYANMRVGAVEVIAKSGTGYKIPVDAFRFDKENNAGIFVLRGKIITYVKVRVLYSDEEYAVVDSAETGGGITLYDDVIIKGKELADGKVIR